MNKINLYNVCIGKNRKKTINTLLYIGKLEYDGDEEKDRVKFDKIKQEALNFINPNDMLDKIGFNPIGTDRIFRECQEHKK